MTGQDLKRLMTQRGLSQLDLAAKAGVSLRSVARWCAHGNKALSARIERVIQGALDDDEKVSAGSASAAISKYDVRPTAEEWLGSYGAFRRALKQHYSSSQGAIKDDTAFCKLHGLSRAQFSRVMAGSEKPSPKILTKLREVAPEAYEEQLCKWHDRESDNWKQLPLTLEDLQYLIEVSKGLAIPLNAGIALQLVQLRKAPSAS
jgi:transcriptional regulator with XRE-family HTH domain